MTNLEDYTELVTDLTSCDLNLVRNPVPWLWASGSSGDNILTIRQGLDNVDCDSCHSPPDGGTDNLELTSTPQAVPVFTENTFDQSGCTSANTNRFTLFISN